MGTGETYGVAAAPTPNSSEKTPEKSEPKPKEEKSIENKQETLKNCMKEKPKQPAAEKDAPTPEVSNTVSPSAEKAPAPKEVTPVEATPEAKIVKEPVQTEENKQRVESTVASPSVNETPKGRKVPPGGHTTALW